MSKIIIAIHGLGNKPPKGLLEKWWLDSIREGLHKIGQGDLTVPFKLVYWADILNPEPENLKITDKDDPLFIDEPYLPSSGGKKAEQSTIRPRILKYLEGQLDKIFLKPDMSLHFEGVSDRIIHSYFSDLEAYYSGKHLLKDNFKRSARVIICERLRSVLKEHKSDDIMLLCHSMGTIIAYDVLTDKPDSVPVNTLVTIGSPLGLPVIVSRIFAEQKKKNLALKVLKTPNSVRTAWFNISDIKDIVALDHTLADDYQPNKHGVLAHDINVYNDYEVSNERNPHKIYGYLRTEEVAKIIKTFLTAKEKTGIAKLYTFIKNRINGLIKQTSFKQKV
jgi:hypothetical protein